MDQRELFETLVRDFVEQRDDRPRLEQEIMERFCEERAVMFVDLCGYSRITEDVGLLAAVVVARQMRALTTPIVERHGGVVLEAKADSVLILCDTVADALGASREIMRALAGRSPLLPSAFELYASIGIGYGPLLNVANEVLAGRELNVSAKLGEDVAGRGEILLSPAACARLDWGELEAEERRVLLGGVERTCFSIPFRP